MYRPRIIPCLLLKKNGLVKTINFENPKYLGDPINSVRIFNEFEADELIFLDIDASKEKRTIPIELIKKIGEETFMPFAVGGGIKNLEDIQKILAAGAEKVIINTAFIENPNLIKEASESFGSQSIIISIDAKKANGIYRAFIYNGTKLVEEDVIKLSKKAEELGAGEIMINSIDNDGKMSGYDLELIKKVSSSVNIPVIACGGAGELADFKRAIKSGAGAVAAGSLFVFAGKNQGVLINYPDLKEIEDVFR